MQKQKAVLTNYQKKLSKTEKVLAGSAKDVNPIYKQQKPKAKKGFWAKLLN